MKEIYCYFCNKFVGKEENEEIIWVKTKVVKGLIKSVRLCDYRCGSGTFVKTDGTLIQDIF